MIQHTCTCILKNCSNCMHMSTATFLDLRKLNMLGEVPINLICKIAPLFLMHIKSMCIYIYIYKQQYRWVRVLTTNLKALSLNPAGAFINFTIPKFFLNIYFFGQIL